MTSPRVSKSSKHISKALSYGFGATLYVVPESRQPSSGSAEGADQTKPLQRRALLAGLLAPAIPGRADALMPEELRAASLFQRVSPSVLTVGEKRSSPSAAPQGPTGTGFVWDASHVVTNFHVVSELKDPHVTFLRKGEAGDEHVTLGALLRGLTGLWLSLAMDLRLLLALAPLALGQASELQWTLPLSEDCEVNAENCSISLRQLRAHAAPSCASVGCHGAYVRARSCQCTDKCKQYRNCCSDYVEQCELGAAPQPKTSPEALIPFETEIYLQFLDEFLEKQPRQKFLKNAGLLQTFGSSLGGGSCDLCELPEQCPEFGSSQRCRFDVYDNAVAEAQLAMGDGNLGNSMGAIYLTKRGKIAAAREILDAFIHQLYPAQKVPHVTFGERDGLPSGRWLTLVGSSYTEAEVKPGIYWGKNVVDGGVDTGNNAWVGIALAQFAAETGESCYLVAARDILTALKKGADCNDKLLGFMAKLRPYPANYRSTEHNIDVYALAKILGDEDGSSAWVASRVITWDHMLLVTATAMILISSPLSSTIFWWANCEMCVGSSLDTWEDAMNRARIFVQEMFGHNDRYPKSFAMGTDGAVPCDTTTMKTAVPADGQFWTLLAGVEQAKERQVSALSDALQSVEDGGMLTTDEDVVGH
eukprot:s2585_g9.t1